MKFLFTETLFQCPQLEHFILSFRAKLGFRSPGFKEAFEDGNSFVVHVGFVECSFSVLDGGD